MCGVKVLRCGQYPTYRPRRTILEQLPWLRLPKVAAEMALSVLAYNRRHQGMSSPGSRRLCRQTIEHPPCRRVFTRPRP